MNQNGGRSVKSVDLTCSILRALRELDGAGVTEIANHVGRSKGAVHNHLSTLHRNELVVKENDEYKIGLKFLDYGTYAKRRVSGYRSAKEVVRDLAEESGEVANFMVEEHGVSVYLIKERGDDAVRTASYEGDRKPLHCTALGKAVLSQFSKERVEEIIDSRGLPKQTDATITERDELFDDLERTRERGYAYDDEEIRSGLRCVAAPVVDSTGEVQGAVSVSGPISRFKGDRFREELPELVLDAANVIQINAAMPD